MKESNSDMYCFFHKYGIRKIIIYGYNILGKHLIEELRNSDIEVCAVVDKKVDCFAGESIASIKKIEFNDVDAVVVTAVNYFGEIYENLKEITSCRIINFEQILTDI